MSDDKYILATYAESAGQVRNVYRLTESLRTFGGSFADIPVWLYIPDRAEFSLESAEYFGKLHSQGAIIQNSPLPEDAAWFYYAGKVYAAGKAETTAESAGVSLIWMDDDTVILSQPDSLALAPDESFIWCPVMHNRSGSLFDLPPDDFWGRVYELLSIDDEKLFPMITPADRQKIRAYFHIGLMSVKPGRGILRRLVTDFEKLYSDPDLAEMCRRDVIKRIFLHQAALVGVLNIVARDEIRELPASYNYPIFFDKGFESERVFDSIENAATIRSVVSLDKIGENWHEKLVGPEKKISWLKKWLPDHDIG